MFLAGLVKPHHVSSSQPPTVGYPSVQHSPFPFNELHGSRIALQAVKAIAGFPLGTFHVNPRETPRGALTAEWYICQLPGLAASNSEPMRYSRLCLRNVLLFACAVCATIAFLDEISDNCLPNNANCNSLNTTGIEFMDSLFSHATSFNQPLNSWDTSSVVTMNSLFLGAKSFNQSLTTWDTSSVQAMSSLFFEAASFNQPINFVTGKVRTMQYMFYKAESFNQPVNFDTSKVTDMEHMFAGAKSFNQPLNFNTHEVAYMQYMFSGAEAFNQPLNKFDTRNVDDMRAMFSGAVSFNQPLNEWDVSSVTNTASMFSGATSFNQALPDFSKSSLLHVAGMFYGAEQFDQDISSWFESTNTPVFAYRMLKNARMFNHDLSKWNVTAMFLTDALVGTATRETHRDQYCKSPHRDVWMLSGVDCKCEEGLVRVSFTSPSFVAPLQYSEYFLGEGDENEENEESTAVTIAIGNTSLLVAPLEESNDLVEGESEEDSLKITKRLVTCAHFDDRVTIRMGNIDSNMLGSDDYPNQIENMTLAFEFEDWVGKNVTTVVSVAFGENVTVYRPQPPPSPPPPPPPPSPPPSPPPPPPHALPPSPSPAPLMDTPLAPSPPLNQRKTLPIVAPVAVMVVCALMGTGLLIPGVCLRKRRERLLNGKTRVLQNYNWVRHE